MRTRLFVAVAALAVPAVAAWTPAHDTAPQAPAGLTVGDQVAPLEVEGTPQFGWRPRDVDPNEIQSAYRLKVARNGTTVWDSGKVASSAQSYVAYGGPALAGATTYTWTVRTWDRSGQSSPWARAASFDTGLSDADWQASWIRRTTAEKDDYTLARKDFTVSDSRVVRARVSIAAGQQYELHLNGQVVDRGAAFAYPGEGYYRTVDITHRLTPGQPATIGAIYHWYGGGQGRPKGEPGLLMRVVVDHADGTRQVVVTDGTWQVARGPWKTAGYRNSDGGDYIEDIDGTADPLGWDAPGFDASAWPAPTVLGVHPAGVFTHLQAQESALTHTTVHPVKVTTLPSGAVVADFGTVIPAVPVIRFRGGTAGTAVSMTAGYVLNADGTVSNAKSDNQDTNLTYGYTERAGDQTYRPFTYEGFRYFQINAAVPAADISAVVQHTSVPAAARVRTSNGGVNAAYDLMLRSALYDSQEQFLDTPTREKGQFLGDTVDVSLATMAGFGERTLTRKAIREFIESQKRYWTDGRLNAVYPNGDGRRDIPDYTEMFPIWVWEYYLQSGDTATLAEAYPVMTAVADYVRRYVDPSTGLVTQLAGGSGAYQYGIIDWPATMRYGYDVATTARTTVNELAAALLTSTAQAATALGKDSTALTTDATTLTTAINTKLRTADGTYIDGLESDGTQSTHASQIANAYALAFNLAPEQDRAALARYVGSLGMQMGPMTAHWLLAALDSTPSQIVARLTDASSPGWAYILAHGGTFTWESWDADTTGQSYSHGWGSTGLVDVQQSLLGVTVTAPAGAQIKVRPPAGSGLDWAKGSVPTQRGPVTVSWRSGQSLTVDVPVNVTAELDVPLSGHLRVDGPARYLRTANGYAIYQAGSGHVSFRTT